MVIIKNLCREYYRQLFELIKIAEPYKGYQAYDQFCQNMDTHQGFTYWEDGELVGCVHFSHFFPGDSVMIHAAFHPLHKAAMNRKVMRQVFDFAFNKLKVHRVITYSIEGISDSIMKFLYGMGFEYEGTMREAAKLPDGMYDLNLFGMLKKDCRWL